MPSSGAHETPSTIAAGVKRLRMALTEAGRRADELEVAAILDRSGTVGQSFGGLPALLNAGVNVIRIQLAAFARTPDEALYDAYAGLRNLLSRPGSGCGKNAESYPITPGWRA